MKKNAIKFVGAVSSAMLLASCSWLSEPNPAVTTLDEYYEGAGGAGCQYTVNGCYVPLCWEFNNAYFPEWFIGDVCSDDALKGGEAVSSAMPDVYYMENFKTVSNNDLLLDFYRAQYQGIGRCNMALRQIPLVPEDTTMTEEIRQRYLGEVYFLRAYYYFRLVRVFGGVPISTDVLDDPSTSYRERATADAVYDRIIADLDSAEARLWTKSQLDASDLGRATKGAAQAMLQKVYLYRKDYAKSVEYANKVVESGEYSLVSDYASNFTLNGENNAESVFEIQYSEESTSDYGDSYSHLGATRGTFSLVLTRGRKYGGWGWNHPTQNLVDEFEAGDTRLGATVFDPGDNIETRDNYLGNTYFNAKLGDYVDYPGSSTGLHDSRGPLNNKQIRYSDVLLMRAEACAELGQNAQAIEDLNAVRKRAGVINFPGYTFLENGITATTADEAHLKEAIRHERRVELGMEGHRWFDLVRWGVAAEVMNAYRQAETEEVRAHMNEFIKGTHELFPIPPKEIELNSMSQNPGY